MSLKVKKVGVHTRIEVNFEKEVKNFIDVHCRNCENGNEEDCCCITKATDGTLQCQFETPIK